jgi:drug/metabolite transporter (DMT)-like permease
MAFGRSFVTGLGFLRGGKLPGLLSALLFDCSAPLVSTMAADGSSLAIAGLLYAGAAMALFLLWLLRRGRHQESQVRLSDLRDLGVLTVLGGVLGPLALVHGLTHLPATASSLLLNLESVFTLLIAVVIGGERLGSCGYLSAGFTIAGAVILSRGTLYGASLQGVLLIALAMLALAIDNYISQRLSLRDPVQVGLLKSACAAIPMLLIAQGLSLPLPVASESIRLLLIGAVGYGLSIWLDLVALRSLGAARQAVIFAATPFAGALLSIAVLGESLTVGLIVAASLMALGLLLLLREESLR